MALPPCFVLETQSGGGGHHRAAAAVDGGDDLLGVDALQVDGGSAELAWPSGRWMMFKATPSWASSTAWAWRSWCGANRRRTPAWVARRCSSNRTLEPDQPRPRVGPS